MPPHRTLARRVLTIVVPALLCAACPANEPRRLPDDGGASTASPGPPLVTGGYAPAGACRPCHAAITESYREVAMARSFGRPAVLPPMGDFGAAGRVRHDPSGYLYEMRREGGRFVQRRFEEGPDGAPVRVFDREISFVIGSGRHVQTFLHRSPNGELTELPVSWYAQERRWGMSPGYDRPDQEDFFRPVTYTCIFCHNGLPAVPAGGDSAAAIPLFPAELPDGIDCQRCHGPGGRHIDLARQEGVGLEAIREAIVNPSRLSADRQMDVCMQCHLETTSSGNWSALTRFGRGVFSFRPGEDLETYRLHFDHPPGTGHDDKFEIAHQAYRLRRSACYRKSAGRLTCTTCHDPHRRPADPVTHFAAKCLGCHSGALCAPAERTRAGGSIADCASCHMPPRRTDDVVHVTMTDHFIRRVHPPRDLRLAPRAEAVRAYRGPVEFYRPDSAPRGSEADLYMGMARVIDAVDLHEGVRRLERAIAALDPIEPEPHFQLGLSLMEVGRTGEAIARLETAAARDPDNPKIRLSLGNALAAAGRFDEAARRDREAIELWPGYSEALTNAGNLLLQAGRAREALESYDRAVEARPDNAEAHGNRGVVLLRLGREREGREALEEAVRINPAAAGPVASLAAVLQAGGEERAAIDLLRAGLRRRPGQAGLLSRLALILAGSPDRGLRDGSQATRLAEEAVRLTGRRDPKALDALAAARAASGRRDEAIRLAAEAETLARRLGQDDLARDIGRRRAAYETAPGQR